MSIQQTLTTSFRQQILQAQQNLSTDTLKLALYTASATLGPNTTIYDTSYEIVGTGYTAGGNILTGVTISTSDNGTVYVDFDDSVWNQASFTARCALIYNASQANKSISVLDFGADKTCQTSFTVQMPPNTYADALIRFN